MDILFLDFETKDRGIDAGLGAGWPYNNLVDVIGYSYALGDAPVRWSTCHNKLKALVESVEAIACHNASYDVGILIMLGIDISQVLIYDTLIMAKLYDNSYLSYSLNKLSEKFFNEVKLEEKFKDIAVELKLVKSKTMDPVKYCKINLDKVYAAYPDVVIDYANQDVELLRKLFYKFTTDSEFFKDHDWTFYSDLLKIVLDIRKRGARIDINQLFKSKELLEADLFSVNNKLSRYLQGRNPNSTVQLAQVCDELNVLYPVTDKGNPSITKAWLDQQEGEFFELLKSYKKMTKLLNDFINKTIDSLKFLNNVESDEDLKVVKFGRLHPEINIMGATATGRMSSSNPNFQQLPKRDPYAKPLVRSIVVPEDGERWYCADFSAQEPRLQVHYAARIGSAAGVAMAKKWNDNPDYDMHTEVANLCGIGRNHAKTINLALSYGMGLGKLSKSLQLSTKEAGLLVKKYHAGAPYLKDLTEATKNQLSKNLYIKTLLGRKLRKDSDLVDDNGQIQDFLYKAINKLVQGGAADQTMVALVMCYRAGVKINFPVHDEVTISAATLEEALKLKYIMENCVRLLVPSKSELTVGPSFANQEPVELSDYTQGITDFTATFKPLLNFS